MNQVLHVLQRVIGELAAVVLSALHQVAQALIVSGLNSHLHEIGIGPEVFGESLSEEIVHKHAVIDFVFKFLVSLLAAGFFNTVKQVVEFYVSGIDD